MADFDKFWKKLKPHEGFYVFDKSDTGGETYMGIARNVHESWSGWAEIDRLKKELDVKALSRHYEVKSLENDVKQFYKDNYWEKIKGDSISNDSVASIIADFKVNGGLTAANIKKIQKHVGVKEDGKWGKETVDAINKTDDQKSLHETIFSIRKDRYDQIIKKKPDQKKFYKGWIKRLNDHAFEDESTLKSNLVEIHPTELEQLTIIGYDSLIRQIFENLQQLQTNVSGASK